MDKQSYMNRYNRISKWFHEHPQLLKVFLFLYRYLSYPIGFMYLVLLIYCFIKVEYNVLVKVIAVPASAFIIVSVIRKFMNTKRPYTKYDIEPLVRREKAGESMPSRHTLSITIIAMSWLYVYPPIGIILWVLSFLMGAIRVIAGVHFVQDVVVAMLISIIWGLIGFWVL